MVADLYQSPNNTSTHQSRWSAFKNADGEGADSSGKNFQSYPQHFKTPRREDNRKLKVPVPQTPSADIIPGLPSRLRSPIESPAVSSAPTFIPPTPRQRLSGGDATPGVPRRLLSPAEPQTPIQKATKNPAKKSTLPGPPPLESEPKQTSKTRSSKPTLPDFMFSPEPESKTMVAAGSAPGAPTRFFSPVVNQSDESAGLVSQVKDSCTISPLDQASDSAAKAMYGYEGAEPDLGKQDTAKAMYGYEDAAPDLAKQDASRAMYGYEDAEPDLAKQDTNKDMYGYEVAEPDSAKQDTNAAMYGYEDAEPDLAKQGNTCRTRDRSSSWGHRPEPRMGRRSSMKGSNPPSARRFSVGGGDQIKVRLPGKRKKVTRNRSISFFDKPEVHKITPLPDLSEKEELWYQSQDLQERKLKIRDILRQAENLSRVEEACNDSNNDSFCLRGIECHMRGERNWRNKTIEHLYDDVLDAQSVQRAGGLHDSFQLAVFSERNSEESRRLALERALADAQDVARDVARDYA